MASLPTGPEQAAQRAVNAKQYLSHDKGIDASWIELRTGMQAGANSGYHSRLAFVSAGASFSEDGTTVVDESSVKPQAPPQETTPQ
jgi:hypothetical protein